MSIRPESGITLEEDNRMEVMWHWGAAVIDICNIPVEEYTKPMTVITDGSGGGGSSEPTSGETTYALKFYLDGTQKASYRLEAGAPIPSVSGEKEGYDFSGWKDTSGNEYSAMPASNLTLYGINTIKKFNVSFRVDNEALTEYDQIVEWGKKVTNIPSSAKTGYVFSGWEPAIPATIKQDYVFNGTFTKKSYTVSFNISGAVQTDEFEFEENITYPATDSKEGYTICGWTPYYATMPDIENLTLKAILSANEYSVKYLIDEGENMDYTNVAEYVVKYGQAIPSQAIPSKSGYSFTQWSADTQVIGNKMPASDVNFFTKKTVNEYTLRYLVDGEDIAPAQILTYGSKVDVRPTYIKEGYTVTEWEFNPALNEIPQELGGGYSMPYYDVIATCESSINSYPVVIKHGNEVIYSGAVEYGTDITTLIPEGYSYTGSVETVPAEGVELSADINSYDVVINFDSIGSFTLDLDYKSDIKSAVEDYIETNYSSELVGHHIESNIPSGATVPAQDVTYTVEIVPNEHTISVSGASDITINYGENILDALEGAVTVDEFHYLDGWTMNGTPITSADTMPDADVVVVPVILAKESEITPVISGESGTSMVIEYGMPISDIIANIVENSSAELQADLDDPGYEVEWTVNGSAYTDEMVVREDEIAIEVTITPKPFVLSFMRRGNEAASEGVIESGETLYKEEIVYPELPSNITAGGKTYEFKWDDGSVQEGTPMPASAVTVYGEYVEKVEANNILYGFAMNSDIARGSAFIEAIGSTLASANTANIPQPVLVTTTADPEGWEAAEDEDEWIAGHLFSLMVFVPEGKSLTSFKVGAQNMENYVGGAYETVYNAVTINGSRYIPYGYCKEDTYYIADDAQTFRIYITIE